MLVGEEWWGGLWLDESRSPAKGVEAIFLLPHTCLTSPAILFDWAMCRVRKESTGLSICMLKLLPHTKIWLLLVATNSGAELSFRCDPSVHLLNIPTVQPCSCYIIALKAISFELSPALKLSLRAVSSSCRMRRGSRTAACITSSLLSCMRFLRRYQPAADHGSFPSLCQVRRILHHLHYLLRLASISTLEHLDSAQLTLHFDRLA